VSIREMVGRGGDREVKPQPKGLAEIQCKKAEGFGEAESLKEGGAEF
jgi:hypothetical protein